MPSTLPIFYLYGEPHRTVGASFVHIEALDDRSRPSEWTIQPHSHAELMHIFAIDQGGGRMHVDGRQVSFDAPCLLLLPAMAVHGFEWLAESSGTVITMSLHYARDLLRPDADLAALFDQPRAIQIRGEQSRDIERLVAELRRELGWSAPGHRAAVDAAMLSLMVIALRNDTIESLGASPGHRSTIVARFRQRVEERFRLREPIADHARALALSETALRMACTQVAGCSPSQILDQRALLEARRALLYTNLSIAEVGFSIGFADPAYFSRFFRRLDGISPRDYRLRRGQS